LERGRLGPGLDRTRPGGFRPLASITLFPCQDIPGVTVHEVWVSDAPIGNDRTKARLAHVFEGHTTNQQALKFDFPKGLSARYVEIGTTRSPTWIAWWEIEIRVRDEKVVPLDRKAGRNKRGIHVSRWRRPGMSIRLTSRALSTRTLSD
jgi:hypothetical protein